MLMYNPNLYRFEWFESYSLSDSTTMCALSMRQDCRMLYLYIKSDAD